MGLALDSKVEASEIPHNVFSNLFLSLGNRLSALSNFSAIPGPDFVDLSWSVDYDVDPPIISFYIFRVFITNDLDEDTSPPTFAVNGSTFHFRDIDVVPGTKYLYIIQAVNEEGRGFMSIPVWAVPGATIPSQPSNLRAESGGHQLNLTWEPPSQLGGTNPSEYILYRGDRSDNLTFLSATSFLGMGRFTDMDLINGQDYYYAVAVRNYFGESLRSDTTHARPFWAPRNLTANPRVAETCGPVNVNLTWENPSENYSDLAFYRIYGMSELITVDRENTSVSGLTDYGWGGWNFRVSAVYEDGTEVFSNIAYVFGPYCEGYGGSCPICPFLVISLVLLAAVLVVVAILFLQWRRKND